MEKNENIDYPYINLKFIVLLIQGFDEKKATEKRAIANIN